MPVHRQKTPLEWKPDIDASVAQYNAWFQDFAPRTYRAERQRTKEIIRSVATATDNFSNITGALIRQDPRILPILRMTCCPPIARDRLTGLSRVPKGFVDNIDGRGVIPPGVPLQKANEHFDRLAQLLNAMVDRQLFPWLDSETEPSTTELERALIALSERHCGAVTDPLIRNAQEARQLAEIRQWLELRGYGFREGIPYTELEPGQFSFRVQLQGGADATVNIPVDAVVMKRDAAVGQLPFLIEAKSAGDFANTNKRWKEEATKMRQLLARHGTGVEYILFLCGYFDATYLRHEAGEGIDWVWEHRIDDLAQFGL